MPGTGAVPASLTERLLDVFDTQAVYNRDKDQVTIDATLTDACQAIRDLWPTPAPTTTPHYHHNRGPDHKIMLAILTGHTGSSHTNGKHPGQADAC